MSKYWWLYAIGLAQVILIGLVIYAIVAVNQVKKQVKNESNTTTSSSTDSAVLNSFSGRLGQVQSDLFQIKSKLGITPQAQ